jgi:D-3-phosphoglycerate dehydrogenase
MPRVLACDKVSAAGLELLRGVAEVVDGGSLGEDDLIAALKGCDALIVRSATKVTARVLENAPDLKVVARAGVGVDNIDVPAATRHGVLVVNSPAGNILAAAEHTVAMMLATARNIPQADASMKAGQFERKRFVGRQMAGKTLSIVGLGKIGAEVARRARALGMSLLVFDPYAPAELAQSLGAELVDLPTALAAADFLTVHTPLTDETRGLIGAAQLTQMKPDAVVINCARGGIVSESALLEALRAGTVGAAALDVFEGEPSPNHELVALPNVIATPHLGASTSEAQEAVAVDAAEQIRDVLEGRPARSPVNVPSLAPELLAQIQPFLALAERLGRLANALTRSAPQEIRVTASAAAPAQGLALLASRFIAGLLAGKVDEPVNDVNALPLAREREIQVSTALVPEDRGWSRLLEVAVRSAQGSCELTGAAIEGAQPRILQVNGFTLDMTPEGLVLWLWKRNPHTPGFIGRMGMLLGEAGVNIMGIEVGREEIDGTGLLSVHVRGPIPEAVMASLREADDIARIELVDFGTDD